MDINQEIKNTISALLKTIQWKADNGMEDLAEVVKATAELIKTVSNGNGI